MAIKEIQGKPTNRPFSLNDKFFRQDGIVGVLTGFQVKYIGTVDSLKDGDTYTWQRRDRAVVPPVWTDFGTGLEYVHNEATMGDYDVRLNLTRVGDDEVYSSDTREVMVAEVECETFTMTDSSNYVRTGAGASPIITPPVTLLKVAGQVNFASGSPEPVNIKQGFIQGMKPVADILHEVITSIVSWNPPNAPSDTMVAYPLQCVGSYPDPPWVNDSACDSYLYNQTSPVELGKPVEPELEDAPAARIIYPWQWVRPNGTVDCWYEIVEYKQWIDARVWLVVVVENSGDKSGGNWAHYVPIKTQAWQLHMDSTDTSRTTWLCEQLESPDIPDGNMTDGRYSTTDDYKGGAYTWDLLKYEFKP